MPNLWAFLPSFLGMQGEVFSFKVCRLAAFLRVSGFRVVVAEEIFLGSEVMDKQATRENIQYTMEKIEIATEEELR